MPPSEQTSPVASGRALAPPIRGAADESVRTGCGVSRGPAMSGRDDFRALACDRPQSLWAGPDPKCFDGTRVEGAAQRFCRERTE